MRSFSTVNLPTAWQSLWSIVQLEALLEGTGCRSMPSPSKDASPKESRSCFRSAEICRHDLSLWKEGKVVVDDDARSGAPWGLNGVVGRDGMRLDDSVIAAAEPDA